MTMINVTELLESLQQMVADDLSIYKIEEYLVNKKVLKNFDVFQRSINQIATRERFLACSRVFDALSSNDISYAVIKGAVLSDLIWKNPTHRVSSDLDVLIDKSKASVTEQIFLDFGFEHGTLTEKGIRPYNRDQIVYYSLFSHQLAPFIISTGNSIVPYVNIDINFSVMWGEEFDNAITIQLLQNTEFKKLFGISFKILSPEAAYIELCLHHYKDMNSIYILAKKGLSFELFFDLYFALKNSHLNIKKLVSLADELNVKEYLYYCLYYTNQIFNDPELLPFLEATNCTKGSALLSYYGLTDNERKEWSIGFPQRVFDKDFIRMFYSSLTQADIKKIKTNHELL